MKCGIALSLILVFALTACTVTPQSVAVGNVGENSHSEAEQSFAEPEDNAPPEESLPTSEPDIEPEPLPESSVEEENTPEKEEDLFLAELEEIEYRIWENDPQELVYAYFDLQYLAYRYMEPMDMGVVLDLDNGTMRNLTKWLDDLIQRRRILTEENLCYVETERFDYTLRFIKPEELSDDRLDFWSDNEFRQESELELHFVVEGEPGKAYPPVMAVNSEHSIIMNRNKDGEWKIASHYFPGAVRKYYSIDNRVKSDKQLREELYEEFAPYEDGSLLMPKADSQPYRGIYAANYALEYTEKPNPSFYHVGDWAGNCMNFVSQCVLHGFGSGEIPDPQANRHMTGEWFSGGGGGTFAWENVDYFWAFATAGKAMRCRVLDGVSQLRHGDVIQTRNAYVDEKDDPDDFSHCLIVAEPDTLLLAQNSPACYVYYSDLVNTKRRFIRPVYMD